jgi:hypothetical protein
LLGNEACTVALGEDGDGWVLAAQVFIKRESFKRFLREEKLVCLLALGVEVDLVMRDGRGRSLEWKKRRNDGNEN